MRKYLFTGLGPHASWKRVGLALRAFFVRPHESRLATIESELEASYGVSALTVVDSGRSALLLAVQTLGLGEGDEILVPGYTCMVVSNAIQATGAKPVYVDIDDTLTMSVDGAIRAITPKTKAILFQYTFGEPGHIAALVALAKKHSLFIIEDAAHTIFGSWNGVLLGTIGDIAITSFGREKALSAERGGVLMTKEDHFAERVRSYRSTLSPFPDAEARRHLVTEFYFLKGKKLYAFGLGKMALALYATLGLIPKIVSSEEKRGQVPHEPKRFPLRLIPLLEEALSQAREANEHRQSVAMIYDAHLPASVRRQRRSGGIPLEYSVSVDHPEELMVWLQKDHIYASRAWGGTPIVPRGSDRQEAQYVIGSCPNAETWAEGAVSLPTHRGISKEDALVISQRISQYVSR